MSTEKEYQPRGWHIALAVLFIAVVGNLIIFGLTFLFKSPVPLLLVVLVALVLIIRDGDRKFNN